MTEETSEATSTRTAIDYVAAVNAVIDIAEAAVDAIPKAHPAAVAAHRFIDVAAPLARAAAKAAPDAAPAFNKAAEAAAGVFPDAINNGVGAIAGAFKGVGHAAGGAAGAAADKLHEAAEKRAQEKARMDARKALLDGAGIRMDASTFMDNWNNQPKLDRQDADSYMDYCGCYAIAVYSAAVKKGNFSKFKNIYIGKSEHMGASIHADLVGLGNVDIYADYKYKQPLYVLLYPGTHERLNELESSLICALDADSSYNKPLNERSDESQQ